MTANTALLRRAADILGRRVADLPVRVQCDWTHDTEEVWADGNRIAIVMHDGGDEVAAYVALMQPLVALYLKGLLESVADNADAHPGAGPQRPILNLARVILHEEIDRG